MDFRLSEEQDLLKDSARDFFDQFMTLANARGVLDGSEQLRDLRTELAKMELLGLLAPADRGGSDATMLDVAVVAEQAGRVLAQSCMSTTTARGVSLLVASQPASAEALLKAAIGGEIWLAVADGRTLELTDDNRLSGDTQPAMDALDATAVLTLVQRDGISHLVAVDLDTPGRIVTQPALDPTRAIGRFVFDGDPATILLSGEAADKAWNRARDLAIVALAAEDLGTVAEAVSRAVTYSKDRYAFGRPIGSFQAVKHAIVDVYVAEEQLRSLVWYAAWAADADAENLELYAAAAGAYASETVQKAAEMLIQVHGGIGFTWEHDAHLFWRRARVDRLLLGSAHELKSRVSEILVPVSG